MTTVRVSRTIEAPIDRVWQVFTDIAGAPQTMSGISAVEILSDGPFGPGFRWRETRRMFGQDATEEMWVTEAEEPRSYSVEAESRGTHYRSTFSFTEVPGGTDVLLTFTGTPLGTLSRVMDTMLAILPKGPVEKAFRKDLADLAAACERD